MRAGDACFAGSFRAGGLDDPEVDDLWKRQPLQLDNQDVGRLEVPMNDALLVSVLNSAADLNEKLEPLANGEVLRVTVAGDGAAANQFHHKIGPASRSRARIVNGGDIRMFHHRQRLPLYLEALDHFAGVHAQLDDLERDFAPDRLRLLRPINDAEPAFTKLLNQFVMANDGTRLFHDALRSSAHWPVSGDLARFEKSFG